MKEAVELVNRFLRSGMTIEPAKRCALICVDEKIKTTKEWLRYFKNLDYIIERAFETELKELKEVKQEIEEL